MTWICSHCGEKFSRYRTRCSADGQRVIEDLAGQLIGGRYRVRELIGVGGMDSTVWKAWQTGTERVVAVKVLPAAEEAAARRFARGARIAANLNHPNCTVVHDYGRTDDGKLFLVMEYLSGQVLQDILGPEGMGIQDTLHVADQVLQALEHAHSQRAVHRDLKPDNLFLCRKNDDPLHVKILDFGIAKYVEEDPEHTTSGEEAPPADDFEDLVTEQRQVCGTPQYMAPEQVVGARIDGRTDLYALGCVMYRMLTGRLPFDGKTRYELYQKHLQEAPRPFSEVRPDLSFPDRLELIVLKSLSKRPEQRFQSAADMRKALLSLDLGEDRARRGSRPRVALKNTSPQDRGGAQPTILPGPAWTLSAPSPSGRTSPPPLPPNLPDDDVGPTILPPSIQVSSGPIGAGRAGNTLAAPAAPVGASVIPSPSLIASIQGGDRGADGKASNSLLNDAVVRHPASRSSLAMAPEVPVSTETEPNRIGEEGEARKRRWTVFAVLGGAFLVGVGGVAVAMRLAADPSPPSGGAEPTAVERAPASGEGADRQQAGLGAAVPVAQGGGVEGVAPPVNPGEAPAPIEPEAPAQPVEPTPGEVGRSGTVIGEALSEAPMAPSLVSVRVESDPPGATVSEGLQVLGTTPLTVELPPGPHKLALELGGHGPQALEVDAVAQEGAGTLVRKVTFAPTPAPQAVIPQPQRTIPPRPPPVRTGPAVLDAPDDKPTLPTVNKQTTPGGAQANPGSTKGGSPTVKLLDDDSPAGQGKKPEVKLLEDDDGPAPKKPQVKTLDE